MFFTATPVKFTLSADVTTSPAVVRTTTGRVLHWAAGYDLVVWLFTRGRERAFREQLLRYAHLRPGERVLDVGCGTGSLAIVAKQQVGPTGEVVGIDASTEMVERAAAKATKGGADVTFTHAVVEALPFPDARFDVVLSTLMLHHLPRTARQQCAREIRRVLAPTGRALVVDFEHSEETGFLSHLHRRHGHIDTRNVVALLEQAGFRCTETGAVGFSSLQYVLAEVVE